MNGNTGGPAFPGLKATKVDRCGNSVHVEAYEAVGGLTMRDFFAANALPAVVAMNYVQNDDASTARRAYALADAMLAARREKANG